MKLPIDYTKADWKTRKKARETYAALQHGLCHHCGQPLDGKPSGSVLRLPINKALFPPNFFKWPVHLHHSHETGMTIGAVHCECNAVLWQYHGE